MQKALMIYPEECKMVCQRIDALAVAQQLIEDQAFFECEPDSQSDAQVGFIIRHAGTKNTKSAENMLHMDEYDLCYSRCASAIAAGTDMHYAPEDAQDHANRSR